MAAGRPNSRGGDYPVEAGCDGIHVAGVGDAHVARAGPQDGADAALGKRAGDVAGVLDARAVLDDENGDQAAPRIEPPDVGPLLVLAAVQAPVAGGDGRARAADAGRFEVGGAGRLRVAHGPDGVERLLGGLGVRKDEAVDAGVEHILRHPFVGLAGVDGHPHEDGLGRRQPRLGDGAPVEQPLQVLGQARNVERRVLEVVDDEVEVAVGRMADGRLAVAAHAQVVDELPEDRLVRVQQRQDVVHGRGSFLRGGYRPV